MSRFSKETGNPNYFDECNFIGNLGVEWKSIIKTTSVYFIQCGDGGPIKIGYATDLKKRLSVLQSANPQKLNVIASVRASKLLEESLHKRLANSRIHGEWFNPDSDVMKFANLAKFGVSDFLEALLDDDLLKKAAEHD